MRLLATHKALRRRACSERRHRYHLHEDAHRIVCATRKGTDPDVIASLGGLSTAYLNLGQSALAEQRAKEGLAIIAQLGEHVDRRAHAMLLFTLGYSYNDNLAFGSALPVCERAVKILRQLPDAELVLAQALNALARALVHGKAVLLFMRTHFIGPHLFSWATGSNVSLLKRHRALVQESTGEF